ncbi:MAG: BamA/TamA family outer membrane protein [Muribaculaceae bacterium]|nr:BamA/TamA family outer membrane protein [Muribaculaceae bacterium]
MLNVLMALLATAILSACSTTRRIPEGEMLYNGLNLSIESPEGVKIIPEVKSDIISAINVKPNNPWPLISPYRRDIFPIGLWVYNNWNDSARGLKKRIYNWLVREPVLVSDVKPDVRLKMMKSILNDNGYFASTVDYEIKPKRNPKIANIDYSIDLGDPYLIDSVIFFNVEKPDLRYYIDSVARRGHYFVKGSQFCVDSLASERVRIANALRNRGYYYFKPEFIEFLADSLMTPERIALKFSLADNIPDISLLRFRTGDVQTSIRRISNRNVGTPDTIPSKRGDIIVYRPAKLRPHMIESAISFRKGRYFSVNQMDRTQQRLARLGIFGNIQIQPIPVDTNPENPTLDVFINCQFERPIELSLEANVTSKSNSYLGPGLVLGVTNNNMFGGAERLSINLSGNYEWQTGGDRSSVFNSYEFGLSGSLAFPRLLAPAFVRRTNREINWTTISLSGNLLNRPHYFRMGEMAAGITYDWNYSRRVSNSFTPFRLTYTKLMRTTHEFDSIMNENPAVALSFENQFIPEMSYTYNYERWLERARINGFNFSATLKEGGNIFWAIWRAFGVKGRKTLFGMPFSQFVKAQAQLVYSRRLVPGSDQWLVSRVLVGAAHAYGNSTEVPYAEQFYIGGANSIRAFSVRSLGPGSYRAPESQRNGYFDQTGTFKLELNTEYRFPIVSVLHGAVFLDAGNIWLMKHDPLRPGGTLEARSFLRDIALGTGAGLRVDIGMLVVRGDLGYGLHAPYDTGKRGYFNIPFNKKAFAFHLAIGYPF